MTTLIRVNPPIVPTSGTIANQYATIGKTAVGEQVTFQPVTPAVLAEIIGLAALGIGELGGVVPADIPAHLFKWHTWLHRMNSWMKINAKLYPKKLALKDVRVPGHLYFLGTISPNDISRQVVLAGKMPLGPLMPADKNTFINAILKGSAHSRDSDVATLVAFVKDVDKIAIQTMADRTGSTNVAEFDDFAEDELVHDGSMIVPVPPVVKHRVQNRVVQVMEQFAGKAKTIPIWGWVLLLMAIFYFVSKKGSNNDYDMSGGGSSSPLEGLAKKWAGTGGAASRRVIF